MGHVVGFVAQAKGSRDGRVWNKTKDLVPEHGIKSLFEQDVRASILVLVKTPTIAGATRVRAVAGLTIASIIGCRQEVSDGNIFAADGDNDLSVNTKTTTLETAINLDKVVQERRYVTTVKLPAHHDVKPKPIVVDLLWFARVNDFGERHLERAAEKKILVQTFSDLGTHHSSNEVFSAFLR